MPAIVCYILQTAADSRAVIWFSIVLIFICILLRYIFNFFLRFTFSDIFRAR